MLNKYPDKGIVFPFPTCKLFFHLFTEHNLRICTISGSTVSTMLSQRLTALWSECALVRPVLWELCLGEKVSKNGRTLQVERGGGCERREQREGAHGPHAVTCWPWGSALAHPRSLRVWARVHSGG